MAKFMVLIFGDQTQWETMSPDQGQRIDEGHRRFAAAARSAILSGEELGPASKSATLRTNAAGRLVVSDGPFLETKEVLGGYYLIEAPDQEAAVALAANLAEVSGGHSWVEIRSVVDHG